ncbi:ABC transporter substrate-binding protein [Chitinimonas lacunae]|uniref:ABC transporter substrate-binding protein n=1 Tax=Chitinimonas lacunae TaxID=1963018 RepID=A0ABV8MJ89_9NEIS
MEPIFACLRVLLVLICAAGVLAKPIRVGYLPDIGFAPLNVADVKGYWREQGVQVQLVPFDDSQSQMKALANGEIDVAGDLLANAIGWQIAGAPIRLAAETHWSNGSVKLLLKSGQDIRQLKGQVAGLADKQMGQMFLLSRYLNANGLRLADFKLQEANAERVAAGFTRGQIQVALLADPYAAETQRVGSGVVAVDSATYQGLLPAGFAINSHNEAGIGAEQWTRFYKGWLKAVLWVRGPDFKWGEFRDLLNARTFRNFSAQSDAGMMDMYSGIKFHGIYDAIKRHGELGGMEYYVRDVLRFMKENGISRTDPQPRTLIASAPFEEALKAFK